MKPMGLKLGLQQRVLAGYRLPFFELLADQFEGGFNIFSGEARPEEMIEASLEPKKGEMTHAYNLHFFGGRFYFCWQMGIVQWLQSCVPDVLILEANPRYLSQSNAIRWMHQQNHPVVGWGLGAPPILGVMAPLQKKWRKDFISQFDAIITYSQAGAASYRAAGIPTQRIFVAANAVTHRPKYNLVDRPEVFKDNKAVVLFVGRLQARKRVDYLLRACATLPVDGQPRLIVVGDGPEFEPLKLLAKEVYPQTEFLGAIFGEALAPVFRAADLFVLPGTGGLALQEAMSFGLPVIAAEADGTQADLVSTKNGWRLPPGDQESLNRVLADALSDIGRLRRMGKESYRIVAEDINLEKMVDVFLQAVQFAWEARKTL
jgi:glycosyltransferase involved in cell wall biosynthesis